MQSHSEKFSPVIVFLFFLAMTYVGIGVLQQSNNALPFFYKNYPTHITNGKKYFDSAGESKVINRIDFETLHLHYPSHFNLWSAKNDLRSFSDYRYSTEYNPEYITTADYLLDGFTYNSQIGIQALFWAKLAKIFHLSHCNYALLKTMSLLFTAFLSAFILLWIKINYGTIASLISLLFFILSTGINLFSESLYWSEWLFLFPLTMVCLLDMLGIENLFVIFILVFPLFLFKFLAGYELMTIVICSAMTPYVWNFLVHKNKSAGFRALIIGAASGIAFLTSLLIYNVCFYSEFKLSGFDYILNRSNNWTLNNIDQLNLSIWIQLLKILIMNFIDVNGYGIPIGFFILIAFTSSILLRQKVSSGQTLFILFLFISSLSWLLVQPGHLLMHPRYAPFIFFLPFGFFMVGLLTQLFLKKNNHHHAAQKDRNHLRPHNTPY